jgi:uncharacterized membrane protein YkoI
MRLTQFACGLVLLFSVGCSNATFDDKSEPIALDSIPKNVMEIAQRELPDVTFQRATKFNKDGEVAYEIKGKSKQGKTQEVEVSASGKVLEIE